jgi:peroxiredoxin
MTFVLGIAVVVLLVAVVMYLKTISEQQVQIMRRIELMELVARDGGHVERDDAGHPHDGLPIGAEFPQFELPDLAGSTVSLADLRADALPVLFFFVSPTCTPCAALVPEFDEWEADLAGKARMVFVTNGNADDNKEKFGEDRLILLQNERELSELLKAQWTPTAVLMDASGRIASHVAAGDTAIRQLVGQIKSHDLKQEFTYFSNGNGHDHGIHIGHEIPSFSLKDLKGNEITADRFRGKRTLVAFWSLSCPFCLEMMDDLREWDETKGADEPELIVFSDGDPAAHEELGLASPIVIDKGHKTSAAFGMSGTPSAVLVGEQGKIISETDIGAPNIWSLLGKKK